VIGNDREPSPEEAPEESAGATTAGGGGLASASTSSTGSSDRDANGDPVEDQESAPGA
jgi:hypothetical protein